MSNAWVPVTERLPDDELTVLVAIKDSDEPVWLGYHDADGWMNVDAMPLGGAVTHWMPLPQEPTP